MGGDAMIVAGVGCRASCPAEDILALVAEASRRAGVIVTQLAAPAFKRDEPGLRGAAQALGLPLSFVEEQALAAADPRCPTRSARVLERLQANRPQPGAAIARSDCDVTIKGPRGFAGSVAEGCALAAAGPGGRLLLARIADARATCAIAEGDGG